MTNNLIEMLKLKEQADNLIEKVNLETKETAKKIAADSAIRFQKMREDLLELQKVVFEFGLTDAGGFIELRTNINTSYLGGTEITVCFNSVKFYSRIEVGACRPNCASRYGYGGTNWNIVGREKPPVYFDGDIPNYDRAVLTLMNNWETAYFNLEKNLMVECDKALTARMKKANDINEKVKANI